MSRIFLRLALLFSLALVPWLTASAQTSVDEIVTRASNVAYYQGSDGSARVRMLIADAQGRERSRELTILRRNAGTDGDQQFYVYFHAPADVAKTSFLIWKHTVVEDDRWMYLPALDLVKRIAASDERTSFVGSHFFYEDVSGRTPTEDTHELVEESDTYYVLQSTPKDASVVEFTHYKSWIHTTTFIPVKIEYYGADGNAYRTYEALGVETIDGFPTVMRSRMSDSRIGGSTTMEYENVRYNTGLSEELFTERYLRSPPRRELR